MTLKAPAQRETGTGRRKEATARVLLFKGTGQVQVNGRDIKAYFGRPTLQMIARQPLEAMQLESRKAGRTRGYAPCSATLEVLISTVVAKCALCGVPEAECTKRLCLDHDHETGEFRGWLCDRCNRLVGTIESNMGTVLPYLLKSGRPF